MKSATRAELPSGVPAQPPWRQDLRLVQRAGLPFSPLDFETWDERLSDSFGRGFINRYFKHGIGQGGHHQYRIDNLVAVLEKHGMQPNQVDRAYFKPLLSQLAGVGQDDEGDMSCTPR